ncbi:MAG: methyltransferase family protein [Methanosarcina sp.]
MSTVAVNRINTGKLLAKLLLTFPAAFLFLGLVLFLPAGTIRFINGWIYIAALMVPMSAFMIYLIIKDPELLEKRINLKERRDAQKKYVMLSMLFFVAAFIIPGLDFRYGWSDVPGWLVIVSLFFMIAGYAGFIVVMLQNRYASRVIEIQENQKVIDTGLYSVVRHPMYLSAIILYLASALVLGSFYALIPMAFLPFLLAFRILNEEELLKNELPGYKEYMEKVKFRMIPFVW